MRGRTKRSPREEMPIALPDVNERTARRSSAIDISQWPVMSALEAFREAGLPGITIRSVAACANVPATTLQAKFKNKADLLHQTFSTAIALEKRHLDTLADTVGRRRLPPDRLPDFYRAVVLAPGPRGRLSQDMLLEILVRSLRDAEFREYARRWLASLQAFWAAFGPSAPDNDFGWFLTELQLGLLICSLGCARPFETSVINDEIVERALVGPAEDDGFWFGTVLTETIADRFGLADRPQRHGKVVERFLTAGARIVATEGPDALTYRRLAREAATSPSAILYQFPTQEHLIYAVFLRMVEDLIALAEGAALARKTPRSHASAYLSELLLHQEYSSVPLWVIHAELRVLASRNDKFAEIAWYLRMANGGATAATTSAPGFDPFDQRLFDGHVTMTWASGCLLAHLICDDAEQLREVVARRLNYGLRRLKVR